MKNKNKINEAQKLLIDLKNIMEEIVSENDNSIDRLDLREIANFEETNETLIQELDMIQQYQEDF